MLVDEQILRLYFMKWRSNYFGFELPIPKFKLTNNFNIVARFECSIDCNNNIYDETIYFSRQYDYSDYDLDNIMAHEMIHYYLCYNKVDLRCTHGKHFKNMAKQINERFLLHVSKYVDGLTLRSDYSRVRKFFSFMEPLL